MDDGITDREAGRRAAEDVLRELGLTVDTGTGATILATWDRMTREIEDGAVLAAARDQAMAAHNALAALEALSQDRALSRVTRAHLPDLETQRERLYALWERLQIGTWTKLRTKEQATDASAAKRSRKKERARKKGPDRPVANLSGLMILHHAGCARPAAALAALLCLSGREYIGAFDETKNTIQKQWDRLREGWAKDS